MKLVWGYKRFCFGKWGRGEGWKGEGERGERGIGKGKKGKGKVKGKEGDFIWFKYKKLKKI